MSGMIERVARAICLEKGRMGDPLPVEMQRVDRDWQNHTTEARAAIKAMRDPTLEMTKAGMDERGFKAMFTRDDAYHCFNAMIWAALKEAK